MRYMVAIIIDESLRQWSAAPQTLAELCDTWVPSRGHDFESVSATIEQKVLEIEHIYKIEKSEHIWNKSQTSDNKVKQKSNTSEKVCTTLNMSEQKSEKYWNVWNNLESLYF